MNEAWHDQARLLLAVLPEVAVQDGLALHGGTAINLFVRAMPRLSVDIDLTWAEIDDRETSLYAINVALDALAQRLRAPD